ncbi:MAG: hypothetical protein ACI4Q4_06450, partial [Oscillospiraceae bacterium]
MNARIKKIAAAAAAIVCAASLSGCVDTGYLMSIDGMDIRNGLYLQGEISAYSEAYTKVSEAREEQGDDSEIEDLFAESIDGKSVSEWIKENALEKLKRYVAINRLAEEKGITLNESDTTAINTQVAQMWDEENFYAQYIYGTDTIGEYYESIGISRDSMREDLCTESLSEKLFLHYFDTDGETPVSDADFDAYLTENYVSVMTVELPKETYQGIPTEDETIIAAIKETAESYAERYNDGESFVNIHHDADLLEAQNTARVDAEDEYAERSENGETLDFDSFVQEAVDAVTVDAPASESEITTTFSKSASAFSDADFTDYIWAITEFDKAFVYDDGSSFWVVVRTDITKNDDWKTDNRSSVLNEMKSDDYEQILKDTYANYTV